MKSSGTRCSGSWIGLPAGAGNAPSTPATKQSASRRNTGAGPDVGFWAHRHPFLSGTRTRRGCSCVGSGMGRIGLSRCRYDQGKGRQSTQTFLPMRTSPHGSASSRTGSRSSVRPGTEEALRRSCLGQTKPPSRIDRPVVVPVSDASRHRVASGQVAGGSGFRAETVAMMLDTCATRSWTSSGPAASGRASSGNQR